MKLKTILLMLLVTAALNAQDWTAWRGPHASGKAATQNLNIEALKKGGIQWRKELGTGHSAVAVKGSRLYTMGSDYKVENGDTIHYDHVYCLDARTGAEIWKHSYTCDFYNYPGPGATPVLDGNTLFTISRYGQLKALDAGSGKVIWDRDLLKEDLAEKPDWGFSSSAIIHGDMLLMNANKSGMAFNKNDGSLIWNSPKEKGRNGSAVVLDAKTALFTSGQTVYRVNMNDGKVLWSVKAFVDADPIVEGDLLIVPGYRKTQAFTVTSDSVTPRWESNARWCFQNLAVHDGHLFGFGKFSQREGSTYSDLQCISLENGETAWSERREIWGSSIIAAGQVIAVTGQGNLIVTPASPEGFAPLSDRAVVPMPDNTGKPTVEHGQCWTMPVLAAGHLYLRNNRGTLIAIQL